MGDTLSIVIAGAGEEEIKALQGEIGDLVDVRAIDADPAKALDLVRDKKPRVALLYLDNDPDKVLEASQAIGTVNGCSPMIVSRDQNPDMIRRAMRSGARDFAYLDTGQGDVRRALLNVSFAEPQQTAGPVAAKAAPPKGTVVVVFSCKGGSGATTIAANLAGALLPPGRTPQAGTVVLLDLDFQMGDVLTFLDLSSRYTWHDLLANLHRLDDDLLPRTLTAHRLGLNVVAQSDALEDADDIEPKGVAKAIRFLRDHYEYVVIDGIRDFSEKSLVALDLADRVLLAMTQDIPALKNANRCITLLRRLGYSDDTLKLVVNRFHRRGKLDIDAIADALEMPVAATIANDFPTVIKTVNEGALLASEAPRARVTKDIRSLVKLIREAPLDEVPKRGLFRRRG